MSKKKKIPKIDSNRYASRALTKVDNIAPLSCCFSLKYLQQDHDFNLNDKGATYYLSVINRLRDLSKATKIELITNKSPSLRCHPIDWEEDNVSRDSFGIPKEEELYDRPYQISLSSNEYGRIHGFFTNNIFNIVWFDEGHRLYSGKNKR